MLGFGDLVVHIMWSFHGGGLLEVNVFEREVERDSILSLMNVLGVFDEEIKHPSPRIYMNSILKIVLPCLLSVWINRAFLSACQDV